MEDKVITPEAGLLDSLSERIQQSHIKADSFLQKFNISKSLVGEVVMYLGIGFLAGFILKKYASIFLTIVGTVFGVWFLHHVGVIAVAMHWQKAQEIFGIQQVTVPNGDLSSTLWQWVSMHITLLISSVIGFLIGMRVG